MIQRTCDRFLDYFGTMLKTKFPIEIFNGKIEEILVSLYPDGTPGIKIVLEAQNKLRKLGQLYRTFYVSSNGIPRSNAEYIGGAIFSMFWICDHFGNLQNMVGSIVRIKFQQKRIIAIGHPIFNRWIQENVNHFLVYPFYSGVPQGVSDKK